MSCTAAKFYYLLRKRKIFFKNYNELKKKIEKKNFSYIINLATYYDKGNSYKESTKILDSNVVYPSIILSLLNLKKIKKIINIGSMLEHENKKSYNPFNLYAASKVAFQDIIFFYKKKFPKIQFYNLKFFETYGFFDKRNKILNIIKKKKSKKSQDQFDVKKFKT